MKAYLRAQRTTKKQEDNIKRTLLRDKSKINWVSCFLAILFCGAVCLSVLVSDIYRMTLINWIVPLFIWFLTGILITPFTSSFLTKYLKTGDFFLHTIYNVVTWGGVVIFGIMAPNYYFPKENSITIKVPILGTGHLASGKGSTCDLPYATVAIKGKSKKLIFPCGFEIESFKFIKVSVKEGLFGIDILTKKTASVD